MQQRTVELRRHADLGPADPEDVLVAASIGPHGELIALWSSEEGREELSRLQVVEGWASFPLSQPASPVPAYATLHDPRQVHEVRMAGLLVSFPRVQPHPDGGVLVVGARCECGPSGPNRNAFVYDADGSVQRVGTLGDDIQHLRVSPTGDTWVGYGDEGVFGTFGWGIFGTSARGRITRRPRIRRGPEPIGAAGIVRFGPDLQPSWHYPFRSPFGGILDCYALNLIGDVVWACYYDDFPIVRISDGGVSGWSNSHTTDVAALIADDEFVALIGDGGRAVVGHLEDGGEFVPQATRSIALPEVARVMGSPRTVIGRGPELHVIGPRAWYRLDLQDLLR